MQTGTYFLIFFNAICLWITFSPVLNFQHWIVRAWDFPRAQITVILVIQIVANLYFMAFDQAWHFWITGALIGGLIYQLKHIYYYTRMADPEVKKAKNADENRCISILVSNVLMTNKKSHKLIEMIKEYTPDVVIALETNVWWEKELEAIEGLLPYQVKIPQDNMYGMHLYSRFELRNTEVRRIIAEEIPSIRTNLQLSEGVVVQIQALHPKPPSPSESADSVNRDGELLIVGREVSEISKPVIVAGDLNDVAWSKSTILFRKISGLLDPRIGRGAFSTYHASYPLFRWPLDHIFHSDHFTLVAIKRLRHIGSDHFPIYIKLAYTPKMQATQEAPESNREDEKLADERIVNALVKG